MHERRINRIAIIGGVASGHGTEYADITQPAALGDGEDFGAMLFD